MRNTTTGKRLHTGCVAVPACWLLALIAPFATAEGDEYLIYYRLLKDKLAGRKAADLVGQKVRVTGVYRKTAKGGIFNRLDSIELDSNP